MANYLVTDSELQSIADALRAKSGETGGLIFPEAFISEIVKLTDTRDGTAVAGDILSGKTAYVNGSKLTGTIVSKSSTDLIASGPAVTAPAGYYAANASKAVVSGSATTPDTTITVAPSISVNASTGVITASNSGSKSVTPTVRSGYVSSGTAGTVTVNGSNTSSMTTKAATTYNTSTSDQSIAAGTFLTGAQTIRKVTTANISAANIKAGVTIKVGDAGDDDRIAGVAGTYTAANTVSSGQTAAAAGQILSGYSAFVGGEEVKGNIASKTSSNLSASGATVTVPAGHYASNASKSVASGSATTPDTTITVAPSISVNASTGVITASNSGSKSVTPTVSAGYVSSGTAGTVTVNGSNTSTMTTKAATTYNTGTSDQTIAAGTYLTGAQTIKAVTTSGIAAYNIRNGVTVKVGDANNVGRIKSVTGTYGKVEDTYWSIRTISAATLSSQDVFTYENANGHSMLTIVDAATGQRNRSSLGLGMSELILNNSVIGNEFNVYEIGRGNSGFFISVVNLTNSNITIPADTQLALAKFFVE